MLLSPTLSSHGFGKKVVLSCNSFLDHSYKVLHVHLSRYFSSSFWQSKETDVNIPPWDLLGDISLDISTDDSDSSFAPQWVTLLQNYNLLSNKTCNIQSCKSDKFKIQYFLTHQSSPWKALYCLRGEIPSFCPWKSQSSLKIMTCLCRVKQF